MGETADNPHALWVNLSSLGEGNIFAILPQLMKQMLANNVFEDIQDFTDVVLPSDETWQAKIYYQLVEKQRLGGTTTEDASEDTMYDPYLTEEKPKLHEWNTLPARAKAIDCDFNIDKYIRKTQVKKGPSPITWTVSDIAKAGCLLSSPPIATNFEDEQEMRRVYTLIYDVFRYKNVLTQALNDVSFFQTFPKLSEKAQVVWLLLYDLYHRLFNKRETNIATLAQQLFDAYGLSFAENALWTQKIKLAAAVARLRIKNAALSLGELLPPHLKDEKVTEQAQNNPVTCWINIYKIRDSKTLCEEIEKCFNLKMVSDISRLNRNNFKWDRHCPHIIVFHASIRTQLAKSSFVKNHILIVQDKSFCLGPATFTKLVTDLELTGSVIQTHINSPRTTAYLATLLAQNEKIKKLFAFSAGRRKEEYEDYFNQLGMSNIKLFSDRLIDTPADATYMEEVVAVFATPPNSYSAVVDPIDLVCSRGGDLSMLEILTETGDTQEARDRVARVLDEQQKTLRFAMSRPQIQFVLYETHSELDAENKYMVDKAINEINKIAKLQHAALQGQTITNQPAEDKEIKEINNNENIENVVEESAEIKTQDVPVLENATQEGTEITLDQIQVPDTDIFDNCQLPMLCPSEACKGFQKEVCGCYLALLQRKEIIRLDDKYMIQMAENRGLFGTSNNLPNKTKSTRTVRRKAEKPDKHEVVKKKLKESEIDRIATPTFTFLHHVKNNNEIDPCPKDLCPSPTSIYKSWWKETSRHISCLRKCLVKQKMVPSHNSDKNNASVSSESKHIVEKFSRHFIRVDEIVNKINTNQKIPIFPKLKLKRSKVFERFRVPITICKRAALYQNYHSFPKATSEYKLWSLDNGGSNVFGSIQSECNIINTENIEKKDAMMMHNSSTSRKLLSKLNSAHIRQFVSPFYRQFDILPQISSPILKTRLPLGYTKHSTRMKATLIQKTGITRSRFTPNKTVKNKFQMQRDGDAKKEKRIKSVIGSKSTDNIKSKKVEAIVARVCIPTQSVLMKKVTKEMVDFQNQEKNRKIRLNALECSKRVFLCKLCKKRNPED